MFKLEDFPSILFHFKNYSRIFRKNSSNWYEIFCPYCGDATRKANPDHGHFFIASDFPFGHCFKCQVKVGLDKLLIDTGFNDKETIEKIRSFSNYVYHSYKSIKSEKKNDLNIIIENNIKVYNEFKKNNFNFYKIFIDYIFKRLGDIDLFYYYILPGFENNYLCCKFYNYDGHFITARFINNINDKIRYKNAEVKRYYYFQNLNNIYKYNNIVICEGIFDCINLSNYLFDKKDNFFLAMNGSHYQKTILNLINSQLLIGNYNIHIVFDKDVKNINFIQKLLINQINILNPNIKLYCYIPENTKDVSECMSLINI